MRNMKRLLLALVALTLALTAAPAAAGQERTFEIVFSAPSDSTSYCYTEHGYWAWGGSDFVWMPYRTVCHWLE